MKKNYLLSALSLFMFFLIACGDKDTPGEEVTTPQITLDGKDEYTFFADDKEGTVSFTTNHEWTITGGAPWLTISPLSGGSGKSTLTLTLSENEDEEDRETTFTILSATAKQLVTVVQKAKGAIILSPEVREVAPQGGTLEVEVKANIDFEVFIEEEDREWITYIETKAMKEYTIVFTISPNTVLDNREGKITIRDKNSSLSETIRVYQTCKEGLIISKRDNIVTDEGATLYIQVTANIEYDVEMPQVPWVTLIETRAVTTRTLEVEVSPNTEYEAREAQIIIKSKNSALRDTAFIYQVQKDAIILSKNEYEIDIAGGELAIELKSNVEVIAEINDSWISLLPDVRSLTDKTLRFIIEANADDDPRTGTIRIVNANKPQQSETIQILQKGTSELLIREKEILIEFYQSTNGDNWTHNDNWCSNRPLNEWLGVTIKNNRVTELRLTTNNLTGEIPESIGELTMLEDLNLYDNKVGGKIPKSIVQLLNLRHIGLSYNEISGEIPSDIGKLVKLYGLELTGNNLTGKIPESIGDLSELLYIDSDQNELTGNIPVSFAKVMTVHSIADVRVKERN